MRHWCWTSMFMCAISGYLFKIARSVVCSVSTRPPRCCWCKGSTHRRHRRSCLGTRSTNRNCSRAPKDVEGPWVSISDDVDVVLVSSPEHAFQLRLCRQGHIYWGADGSALLEPRTLSDEYLWRQLLCVMTSHP